MRRFVVLACLACAVVAAGAGTVLAASPQAGARYRGTLTDYFNNAPRFRTNRTLVQQASFRISTDGTHVVNFVGHYAYYCGSGKSAIRAGALKIVHGHFSGIGSRVEKGLGTNYFSLYGQFGAHGTATITYLDDFVAKSQHVAEPYSFAYHPPSQACESKVTGTLSAH